MKKLTLVFVLFLGSIFGVSNAIAAKCPNVIFYSKTVNQKKEVFICMTTPEKLYYSFGVIGAPKPEMSLWVGPKTATWGARHSAMVDVSEVNIKNGNVTYNISVGTNDDGNPYSMLSVYRGYKLLTTINLDVKSVQSNISSLEESNIPETDDL